MDNLDHFNSEIAIAKYSAPLCPIKFLLKSMLVKCKFLTYNASTRYKTP